MPELPSLTITATATLPPRDSYYITILGAMNPTIHHVYWYRYIGAIDEQELQESIRAASNVSSPMGSQIQFGTQPISINCQPNQWTIQSQTEELWSRMIEITSIVFNRLNDTPVSGFALTIQRHLQTDSNDVKAVLADRIRSSGLGFPTGKSYGSAIGLNVIQEDFKVLTSVQPSVLSERDIFVLYQRQHETPKGPELEYFDVGPLVESHLTGFRNAGNEFLGNVLSSINSETDN